MRQLFLFILLISVSFQAGCSTDRDFSTQAAGEPLTDASLQSRIESRIYSDPELLAAGLRVSADADSLNATVSGNVASEDLRSRAMQLARSAYPNLNVENDIDVRPMMPR